MMMKYDMIIGAGLTVLSLLILVMAESALIEATSTTQEAREQIEMMRMQMANAPTLQEPVHVRASREQ